MRLSKYKYLQLFYIIRFLGDSLFHGFYVVYLNSIGLSTIQITIITSAIPLLAFAGSLLFRKLANTLNKNRLLMVIIGLIEGITLLLYLLLGLTDFVYVIFLTILTATVNASFYQLMDGYSATFIKEENKTYAALRGLGTFGYFIGLIVGGFLSSNTSYKVVFIIAGVILISGAVMAYFLPRSETILSKEVVEKDIKAPRFVYTPRFLIFLFWSLFVMSLATISDNFFGVYLEKIVGINSDGYGYIMAVAIVLEAVTMFALIKMKKPFKNPAFSMIIIGLLGSSRFFAIGLHPDVSTTSNTVLIFVSLLRGIGWGLYLTFIVVYLTKIIPLSNLTKALFTTSIVTTLGRSLGGFILGFTVEKNGYNKTYLIFGLFVVLMLVVVGVMSYFVGRKEKKLTIQQNNVIE